MLGCFLKNNKEVFKAFKGHLKKKEAIKVQSSSSDESEQEVKQVKAGSKRKAQSSSSSDAEESSDDDKKKKASKKTVKANKRQRTDSVSSRTRALSDVSEVAKPAAKVTPMGPPPVGNYQF